VELHISETDIPTVTEVAKTMGASLRFNSCPKSYATENIHADVVIKYQGIEWGIKDGRLVFDNMYGKTVSRFVRDYLTAKLKRRGMYPRVSETDREYVLTI
jgi:hypothetical protein